MPDVRCRMPDTGWPVRLLCLIFALAFAHSLNAYDLSQVKIEKLSNGLTVMMLEDHTQPLVSTQMLYKVGARNECDGTTGVAHFCEHMAFRATNNFPNTDVVSRIYAIGGEWHGYTWIDQTTYYETVPKEDLDLTLRIQADRMANALIKDDEIEAERGAVLTELHGYENDPASVLNDQVNQIVFLEHPYRNNTIGWTSDVEKLTHADIANFYHKYYNPSNAVLAIAGDIDPAKTLSQVQQYFGSIPAGESATMPRTVEPPQRGERRVTVNGSGTLNYFQIEYHAPAAHDPDYAAFLVLQAVLGGSSGVNFHQNESSETAHSGTRLENAADDIGTFFIPTADPYIFAITGTAETSADRAKTEEAIEKVLAEVRANAVSVEEIGRARKQLCDELVYDIETTEDAAHQMAYFEGIAAFPLLQSLLQRIEAVTPEQVQNVARRYLEPSQRTIGWYVPESLPGPSPVETMAVRPSIVDTPPTAAHPMLPSTSPPRALRLKNGIALIVKSIGRTPAGYLRILIPTNTVDVAVKSTRDRPVWGYTSINFRFLKEDLSKTITTARKVMDGPFEPTTPDTASMENPEIRLDRLMKEMLEAKGARQASSPAVITVVGDVNEAETLSLLKTAFSSLKPQKASVATSLSLMEKSRTVSLPGKAQSEFGYFLKAPRPADPGSIPYRLLLYILTHNYEGRFGKELIARTGIIYFIASQYNSNGPLGWISITFGVDPDKLKPAQDSFNRILSDLHEHPPTAAEVNEAKENLIGRRRTAYQSDEELSGFYAREWIEQGRLLSHTEFEKQVRSATPSQVLEAVQQFLNGSTAIIDTK
jgi:zinc protease